MARNFCKHYRGMHEKTSCEAGVAFATLEHYGTKLFMASCPCFGPEQTGVCDHKTYRTAEEAAAEAAETAARMKRIGKARAAIVKHLGGPWRQRGTGGGEGQITCPVCGQADALMFSRASYNGHIHARCKTAGCVSLME